MRRPRSGPRIRTHFVRSTLDCGGKATALGGRRNRDAPQRLMRATSRDDPNPSLAKRWLCHAHSKASRNAPRVARLAPLGMNRRGRGIYTPARAWYFPRPLLPPPRAQVALLVEQRTENPRVGGSIPSLGTTSNPSKLNALCSSTTCYLSIQLTVRPLKSRTIYSDTASPDM